MPIVRALSFADPSDLAAYQKAIPEDKTEAEALEVGDKELASEGMSQYVRTNPCVRYHRKISNVVDRDKCETTKSRRHIQR
jgi:hypothetical protein